MNNLAPVELKNQRVLTTQQLAEVYEATSKNIQDNFSNHKDHFIEGKHYYILQGEELKAFKKSLPDNIGEALKFAPTLYLWTERGANRHCKILDTDKVWEQFDNLEETYFNVKEQRPACIEDVLIQSLQEMKEVKQQIQATNKRIDSISDIVALDTTSWREDARRLIVRIAQNMGGNEYIREVNAEVFRLVDKRAKVNLATRVTNKRRRMADEGICKSKRDKVNKVDIIADDNKLIEIYVAIVKEMSVKYGVVAA